MEWISVKDRLPEPSIDVLVCVVAEKDTSFEQGKTYHAIDSRVIWTIEHPTSFRTDAFGYGKVTHWMPLPSLPDCPN